MVLKNFTDNEAIERCISLRDNLPFDDELDVVRRWADKDALAQVINLAVKQVEEQNINTIKATDPKSELTKLTIQ